MLNQKGARSQIKNEISSNGQVTQQLQPINKNKKNIDEMDNSGPLLADRYVLIILGDT